ncbi:MAG: hypothetical protein Q8L48_44165 [Archangium sp.]|nr:hypothetical protein [Archangium sp.]
MLPLPAKRGEGWGEGRLLLLLLLASCATPSAGQGGARFDPVTPTALTLPPPALFAVCWPQDAHPAQRIALTFVDKDVLFEAKEGASNSTGRCIREIAATVKWATTPVTLEVAPPQQPIDGWAVLAWVKLLSSSRFGPERGLIDPAPLVSACLSKAGPVRPSTSFLVRHTPGFEVRALPSALSDSERCVEAALSATAWPSSRELFFQFSSTQHAPAAEGDVSAYVAPSVSTGVALDPLLVKDVVRLAGPKVAACWDAALVRRTTIGGGRTFRFRVDDTGAVTNAWVTGTMSEGATAADYLLDRCLGDTLKGLHFPPSAGDGVYTWVFATRG